MPQLTWVGKDKVKNHHHDVPFRLLNTNYRFTANEGTPFNSTQNKIIHGETVVQINHWDNMRQALLLLADIEFIRYQADVQQRDF